MNKINPYAGCFPKCNGIAAYYESLGVPSRQTTGFLGGRSFTWYLTEDGQPFQISCDCNFFSLGWGILQIKSRTSSENASPRAFSGYPVVDAEKKTVFMKGMFGFSDHVFRLPTPDKK